MLAASVDSLRLQVYVIMQRRLGVRPLVVGESVGGWVRGGWVLCMLSDLTEDSTYAMGFRGCKGMELWLCGGWMFGRSRKVTRVHSVQCKVDGGDTW